MVHVRHMLGHGIANATENINLHPVVGRHGPSKRIRLLWASLFVFNFHIQTEYTVDDFLKYSVEIFGFDKIVILLRDK